MPEYRIADAYIEKIYQATSDFDFTEARAAAEEADRTKNTETYFRVLQDDKVVVLSGDDPHANLEAYHLVQAFEQAFDAAGLVKIREYEMGSERPDIRVAEISIPMTTERIDKLEYIHQQAAQKRVLSFDHDFVVNQSELDIPEEVLARANIAKLRRAIEDKLPEQTDKLGEIYVKTKALEHEGKNDEAKSYLLRETLKIVQDLVPGSKIELEQYEHYYGEHLTQAYETTKENEAEKGKVMLGEMMWVLSHAVENYRGQEEGRDGASR